MNKEIHFEDLNTFWDFAMQDSNAYNKSSRSDYDLGWSGGLTWDEAKIMAKSGWLEGMKEIEKYRARILPIVADKVLRPQPTYSIAGYNVDVGSFLAGEPECFMAREWEERNYPGRIFKLVCSISFSSSIEPKTIIQRGAMICALIDAIEYAGHRVEVICNDAMSANNYKEEEEDKGEDDEYGEEIEEYGQCKEEGWLEISVVVKKTSQPLEMTDLAFCLAHPSMLRRLMFSVAEIEGWSDYAINYGYPSEATDKGDIYIREIFSGKVSDENAINWVIEELVKLGINIESN